MGKILVTGCAGFIGYHLTQRLVDLGLNVYGLDNLNSYYDIKLKKDRLAQLIDKSKKKKNFKFTKLDLRNRRGISEYLNNHNFEYVFHLGAQAGVRYSIENPDAYFESNIVGTYNLLSNLNSGKLRCFIQASTSSVYGNINTKEVFEQQDLNPIQFYATTKVVCEKLCEMQSMLNRFPVIIFRFFTVYGPWGRPDMALFKFVDNIINNKKIELYNKGFHSRSFTHVDDVVYYLEQVLKKDNSNSLFNIYNLGNPTSINLLDFLSLIEKNLAKKAIVKKLPLQQGDIEGISPNVSKLIESFGNRDFISIEPGIKSFINWYTHYYNAKIKGLGDIK
jgi:UDP-glucuronate 4-epimerase